MYWNRQNDRYEVEGNWRLIETWDVLKFCLDSKELNSIWINRNMRCIEIAKVQNFLKHIGVINRNMRCIEIVKLF